VKATEKGGGDNNHRSDGWRGGEDSYLLANLFRNGLEYETTGCFAILFGKRLGKKNFIEKQGGGRRGRGKTTSLESREGETPGKPCYRSNNRR